MADQIQCASSRNLHFGDQMSFERLANTEVLCKRLQSFGKLCNNKYLRTLSIALFIGKMRIISGRAIIAVSFSVYSIWGALFLRFGLQVKTVLILSMWLCLVQWICFDIQLVFLTGRDKVVENNVEAAQFWETFQDTLS